MGRVISLECEGFRKGYHWLGVQAGRVSLLRERESPETDWIEHTLDDGELRFESATDSGPGAWLYGKTDTGDVLVVANDAVRVATGDKWKVVSCANDLIRLECQGEKPEKRWLDGNTVVGKVYLVPDAQKEERSGTRWRIHLNRRSEEPFNGRKGLGGFGINIISGLVVMALVGLGMWWWNRKEESLTEAAIAAALIILILAFAFLRVRLLSWACRIGRSLSACFTKHSKKIIFSLLLCFLGSAVWLHWHDYYLMGTFGASILLAYLFVQWFGTSLTRTLIGANGADSHERKVPLHVLSFDFKDAITNHGWKFCGGSSENLTVNPISHDSLQSGIDIATRARYALDYKLLGNLQKANSIEFCVRLPEDRATLDEDLYPRIYVKVMARNSAESFVERWLAVEAGKLPPRQVNSSEWVVYSQPKSLHDGWIVLAVDLPKMANKTLSKENLRFVDARSLRIRGNLSLSRISFFTK
jgi:hypothetical protein